MTEEQRFTLASIVKKAKGTHSLEAFAAKTGISKYQLSRIMNGRFKNFPRESTLSAIIQNSNNKGAALELSLISLQAFPPETVEGGNNSSPQNEPFSYFLQYEVESRKLEIIKRKRGLMLEAIYELPFEWTRRSDTDPIGFDWTDNFFSIDILGDRKIKKWYFYFIPDTQKIDNNFFCTFIGKIALYKPDASEKISLVSTDKKKSISFWGAKFDYNANISVITFDDDEPYESNECSDSMYVCERYFVTNNQLTDEDLISIDSGDISTGHITRYED